MSAQYCDLPNQISKLIVLHAQIQKREITVVLRHTLHHFIFWFHKLLLPNRSQRQVRKTPQQIHQRR